MAHSTAQLRPSCHGPLDAAEGARATPAEARASDHNAARGDFRALVLLFVVLASTSCGPSGRNDPSVKLAGARGHWLSAHTLVVTGDIPARVTWALGWSQSAEIRVQDGALSGGAWVDLWPEDAPLAPALAAAWPHLAALPVFHVPEELPVDEALRGQLVLVARDSKGVLRVATEVQSYGVLDELYAYEGPLGAEFDGDVPTIRVWAPTAQHVRLVRFSAALEEQAPIELERGDRGAYTIHGDRSWYDTYYQLEIEAYQPATGRVERMRTTDPYSIDLSANGQHTHLVRLDDPATEPPGWRDAVIPALAAPEDTVIYELHVRDFSAEDGSVPKDLRGKFLAFTLNGALGRPESNGMRHLRQLAEAGLNTVHLLPVFDSGTIPERAEDRVDLDDPVDRLCSMNRDVPVPLCRAHSGQSIRAVLESLDPRSTASQSWVGWMRRFDAYNWGYDPVHYAAPEGSYATDPTRTRRIRELRAAIQGLAQIGLRVALDVVYNHTFASGIEPGVVLDAIVPGYYHRRDPVTGAVERSTCCANTATEHFMMERLMIDTLQIWAREYKVAAFRFDLMGHHMRANMEHVKAALGRLTPEIDGVDGRQIYLYGEGWDFGEVAKNARGVNATQANMAGLGIGTFNDRLRDAARGGGPFDTPADKVAHLGFIQGAGTSTPTKSAQNTSRPAKSAQKDGASDEADLAGLAEDQIKVGLAGNLRTYTLVTHDGAVRSGASVPYGEQPCGYASDPSEVVTYVSAHDNETLFDINQYKLPRSADMDTRVRAQNLGLDLVLLAQGIPFLHAGDEILRSKSMDRNSYDSGDWFNAVDWSLETNGWRRGLPPEWDNGPAWPWIKVLFGAPTIDPASRYSSRADAHARELLRIRSSSPLFRLRSSEEIERRIAFLPLDDPRASGVIVMSVSDAACTGSDLDPEVEVLLVVFNARETTARVKITGARDFHLHPIQAQSSDSVVKGAAFEPGASTFVVPARTTAVFERPQRNVERAPLDGPPYCREAIPRP